MTDVLSKAAVEALGRMAVKRPEQLSHWKLQEIMRAASCGSKTAKSIIQWRDGILDDPVDEPVSEKLARELRTARSELKQATDNWAALHSEVNQARQKMSALKLELGASVRDEILRTLRSAEANINRQVDGMERRIKESMAKEIRGVQEVGIDPVEYLRDRYSKPAESVN